MFRRFINWFGTCAVLSLVVFIPLNRLRDKGYLHEINEVLDGFSFPKFGNPDAVDRQYQGVGEPQKLPLPRNGMSHVLHYKATPNDLMVVNKSMLQHSLLKIEDAETGKLLSKHFIRAGESYTIKVPDGRLRIKIATGDDWYGEPYLFGSTTDVYQSSRPIVFNSTRGMYFLEYHINLQAFSSKESQSITKTNW